MEGMRSKADNVKNVEDKRRAYQVFLRREKIEDIYKECKVVEVKRKWIQPQRLRIQVWRGRLHNKEGGYVEPQTLKIVFSKIIV